MTRLSPRRARMLRASALVAFALTACSDKRIRELDVGISKDSALKILGDGVPAKLDTIQNVYRHNRYFVQGHEFDIYMFDADNRKVWEDPEVLDKELTPVVVMDGKVDGWGWGHMDDVTSKYGIRLRAGTEPTPQAPTPPPAALDSAKKSATA